MKQVCQLAFVGMFVVGHLLAPWLLGEVFPITISPMFCDQPAEYCLYRVTDLEGNSLEASDFGLHLVYDGNPPGLGMGIQPQPTLHAFGETTTDEILIRHVQQVLDQNFPELPGVSVEIEHVRHQEFQPVVTRRTLVIDSSSTSPAAQGNDPGKGGNDGR